MGYRPLGLEGIRKTAAHQCVTDVAASRGNLPCGVHGYQRDGLRCVTGAAGGREPVIPVRSALSLGCGSGRGLRGGRLHASGSGSSPQSPSAPAGTGS